MALSTNIEKQVLKYNKRLEKISKTGIADAAANTLDNLAFQSNNISFRNFQSDHIVRNQFFKKGLLFNKTKRGIPIKQMESRQGSIRSYAPILEKGGKLRPNDEFLSIPTTRARVGGQKAKVVAKRFRAGVSVQRLPGNVKGNARQKFAAMLSIARKRKDYSPMLITPTEAQGDSRVPQGVFRLAGQGRGNFRGGKIQMLRSLKKSANIKGKPFISPAGVRSANNMDRIYIRQAKRTLKRFGRDI